MDQISLFDILEETKPESGDCIGIGRINDCTDDSDYLKREKKILSLLRSKKQKEFVSSDLFDAINRKTFMSKGYSYLLSCSEKLLALKWEKASSKKDYESFFSALGQSVVVSDLGPNDEASLLISDIVKKQKFEGAVKIQIGEKVFYAPIGKVRLTRKQHGRRWYYRGSPNKYTVIDVPMKFKLNFLCVSIRERIKREIEGLTEEQLKDNRVMDFLSKKIFGKLNDCVDENGIIWMKDTAFDVPYIKSFIKIYNLPVSVSTFNPKMLWPDDLGLIWFISDFPYVEQQMYIDYYHLEGLCDLLLSIYDEEKQTHIFHKNLASEYARAYQTKKAIPQKILRAMKNSSFNDFFGYVEFDAECDLNKVAEIEKEFKALHLRLFSKFGKKPDVSLRFRKLGKHKALGLYFPYLKCMCVDVRSPSSFIHEYAHVLDYESGSISKGVKFFKIREVYAELLNKYIDSLPASDPIRVKLLGNTKYNKEYYLEPTEIFARCMEMYLVRILNVDNSLVKPERSFAYPDDERLNILIKEFFDIFLCDGDAAVAAASA